MYIYECSNFICYKRGHMLFKFHKLHYYSLKAGFISIRSHQTEHYTGILTLFALHICMLAGCALKF